MKKQLITISVVFYTCMLLAQSDTVYISKDKTTTIVVPGLITSADIGSNKLGIIQVSQNSLSVKPTYTAKEGENTSLLIQFRHKPTETGYAYYSATLWYAHGDVPFYYDVRRQYDSEKQQMALLALSQKEREADRVKRKIAFIKNRPIDMDDVGEVKEDIIVLLRVIGVDDEYLYLRFELKNNSAIDYHIQTVDLSYVKKISRGLFKKAEYNQEPVSIEWGAHRTHTVMNNHVKDIAFALPLYGIKSNDYLQVMIREKQGSRDLECKVYGKTITDKGKYILLEDEKYRE